MIKIQVYGQTLAYVAGASVTEKKPVETMTVRPTTQLRADVNPRNSAGMTM
jgi:hypothetical protein